MTYSSTIEESTVKNECNDLGIKTRCVCNSDGFGYAYVFIFETEEDKNLYRLNGSIKENQVIRFDTVGRK